MVEQSTLRTRHALRLSRWLGLFAGLWLLAGSVSALLHLLADLDRELAKQKKKLRELSLVSVQDPWSRDPLVSLRRDLIESYYLVQGDLDKMRDEPEGSSDRQELFRVAIGRLQERRARIVETTRDLGIRPQEVDIEADTRQRIYGIAAETSVTAPR